jgi:hypothetical protein
LTVRGDLVGECPAGAAHHATFACLPPNASQAAEHPVMRAMIWRCASEGSLFSCSQLSMVDWLRADQLAQLALRDAARKPGLLEPRTETLACRVCHADLCNPYSWLYQPEKSRS